MTCRPDKVLFAAFLALLALPALAGSQDDPLVDAVLAIERGDGVSAEIAARQALKAGKPPTAVAAFLGEAAMLQDNADEARRWLGPGDFDAASAQRGFHALGRLEMEAGNYGAAAEAFNQALQHGGDDARLWVDIGRMRYLAGEQHIAGDAVSRALALDPDEPQALAFQAQLVRDSQGLAAALPWFERAMKRAPADLDLLGEYAATLGELGRYKDMLRVARRMAGINRAHPRAYFLQAVLAARAGDDDLARRLLWRTADAYADVPAAMLLEGVLEYRSGNPALAVEKFAELARRQPDNEMVDRLLARALLANGDASEVIARYAALAQTSGASAYTLTLVGRAYEQVGRRDLAAPFLDRAARTASRSVGPMPATEEGELAIYRFGADSARADVAVPLLRKMLADGRAGEVGTYVLQLRERFPGSADIEVLIGDADLLAGDLGSAFDSYRSAGQVRWTAALATRIALTQRQRGQDPGAEATLSRYLDQHPLNRAIAMQLGRAAAARGDWRGATELLGRAAGQPGSDRDPALLSDLAEAQLRSGNSPAALASARRAYQIQRASPRATGVLAQALQASGEQRNGARVLLTKARELGATPALAQR